MRLKSVTVFWHAAVASFLAPAMIILLTLLSLIPIPWGYYSTISAGFPLIAVYFWSVYRPVVISPTLAFICGLVMDFLTSEVIGIHAFLFVSMVLVARSQRKFALGQGFLVIWVTFFIIAFLYTGLRWLILAFSAPDFFWPDLGTLLAVLLLTFLYPAAVPFFLKVDKIIQDSDDVIA